MLLTNKTAIIYGAGGPSEVPWRALSLERAWLPDTPGVAEAWTRHTRSAGVTTTDWESRMADGTLLERLPKLRDVARSAVIMTSDYASSITAAVTNLTCGELTDWR
jgi:hypothetical protein